MGILKIKSVHLTIGEVECATALGVARRKECIKNKTHSVGFGNQHYYGTNEWGTDIDGAGAEEAFCKYKGIYWGAPLNNFKGGDSLAVDNLQIRHTELHINSLIIRPKDNDDHYYVLVTGQLPDYVIRGYILGKDGKNDKWIRSPHGKDAAWFIPQDALKCVDNLYIENNIIKEK